MECSCVVETRPGVYGNDTDLFEFSFYVLCATKDGREMGEKTKARLYQRTLSRE